MSEINKVTVLGLGAIGSNLLLQLAKTLPDLQYVGIDYDKVEVRNIGPQAYMTEHVNAPKAKALAAVIARYARRARYQAVDKKLTEVYKPEPNELVLDCFDNTASRKLTTVEGHVLHVGFSPFYSAEAIWSPHFEPAGDVPADAPDICTMAGATPFIHFVVNAAALLVVNFVLNGIKRDLIVIGSIQNGFNLRYLS